MERKYRLKRISRAGWLLPTNDGESAYFVGQFVDDDNDTVTWGYAGPRQLSELKALELDEIGYYDFDNCHLEMGLKTRTRAIELALGHYEGDAS